VRYGTGPNGLVGVELKPHRLEGVPSH
jgi:hypothetical protein